MSKIVLDAMGGDFYPDVNINAAILATKELNVEIVLVGDTKILKKKIDSIDNFPNDKISIVHADEVISMSDSPAKSFRKKKKSSIHIGLKLVADKKADGFVSAGNTGAVLTASTFILGRIDGVERPVLSAVIPSEKKSFVMLDMGSNIDCKPHHLVQFAIMGNCFSKEILHIEKPRVGLLNIGEEKEKGNILTQQTYEVLNQTQLNFIGNVEGKDLTKGNCDVVVCDGFVGNNILKFGEGISKLFRNFFKEEAKRSLLSLIGLLFLKPAFKRFQKKFDYDAYGGAHFLGVNGISIIAHGSASEVAIKNAINVAHQAIQSNMVSKIHESLKNSELTNISQNTVLNGQ